MSTDYPNDRPNGNTLRQELWRIEDRLAKDIENTKRELSGWHDNHTQTHHEMEEAHRDRSAALATHIENMRLLLDTKALTEAKREGALAVVLLIINTLGRNWQLIAAVIAFLLFITNNIRISAT